MNSVHEAQLENGLKVIIDPSHAAPVVTAWVWYRVGSRNERPGITGISHWVEHMTFKGTPKRGKGDIFRETARHGGYNNGFTSEDYTVYYETLPAAQLALALDIEADRMANGIFDAEEVDSERTVILSEREGSENNPNFLLGEALRAVAFRHHPYRSTVIGERSDLLAITRDELYEHYRTYYTPNNATLVIAGDVDAETAMRMAEDAFGGIARGPEPPPVRPQDPPQIGERRVTVRRPGSAVYLNVAYHIPAGDHPDTYPLMMLDAILSGAKAISWNGGGYMGRSARVYRALVETRLATRSGTGCRSGVDPNLFSGSLTVRHGTDPAEAERALIACMEGVAEDPPTAEEMAKTLRQAEAQFAYSRDGVTSRAFALGAFEAHTTWRDLERHLDKLRAVTPEDVQRVAATYLREENRTVGVFLPSNPTGGDAPPAPELAAAYPTVFFATGHGFTPRREVLDNGITLLWHENHTTAAVALRGSWCAGSARETDEQAGIASFTGRLLRRGTQAHTAQEISEAIEEIGASFSAWGGTEESAFAAKCLGQDVETVLDILQEVVERPSFPAEEVEKSRGDVRTELKEMEDSTRGNAERAVLGLLYPHGHPYSRPSVGRLETVESFRRGDLVAFHEQFYHADGMLVSFAGNADPDRVRKHLGRWFQGKESRPPAFTRPDHVHLPDAARSVRPMPHKSQVDLVIAAPGVPRYHEDYYAFAMANLILGSLGLMGRLGENVRERQGMAYYVYSRAVSRLWSGEWLANAGVSPANVDRAIEAILEEVRRFCAEPVTDQEFSDARDNLIGSLALALETSDGIAGYLLSAEYYGLPLDYLDHYPGIIRGLTKAQLQAAAQRYLRPETFRVSIAGPYTGE